MNRRCAEGGDGGGRAVFRHGEGSWSWRLSSCRVCRGLRRCSGLRGGPGEKLAEHWEVVWRFPGFCCTDARQRANRRSAPMIYRFDTFEIDTAAQELRRDGDVLPVEPQVFALLVLSGGEPRPGRQPRRHSRGGLARPHRLRSGALEPREGGAPCDRRRRPGAAPDQDRPQARLPLRRRRRSRRAERRPRRRPPPAGERREAEAPRPGDLPLRPFRSLRSRFCRSRRSASRASSPKGSRTI